MNEPVCPECIGSGFVFRSADDDKRTEHTCPLCNGSGSNGDALYRKLAGQDQESRSTLRLVERERSTRPRVTDGR